MAVESTIKLNIAMRLKTNEVFRNEYFRTRSRNEIATQLIALRKKRRMTQKGLAVALKTKQSAVSRMEKSEYASWSNQTLEQIAEVLHARWRHILEPLESVILQYEHEERELHNEHFETAAFSGISQDIPSLSRNLKSAVLFSAEVKSIEYKQYSKPGELQLRTIVPNSRTSKKTYTY